jgi:hypothetical protein
VGQAFQLLRKAGRVKGHYPLHGPTLSCKRTPAQRSPKIGWLYVHPSVASCHSRGISEHWVATRNPKPMRHINARIRGKVTFLGRVTANDLTALGQQCRPHSLKHYSDTCKRDPSWELLAGPSCAWRLFGIVMCMLERGVSVASGTLSRGPEILFGRGSFYDIRPTR